MVVPLEFSSGEERYKREPAYDETPERIFERRWALSVLDRVVENLRNEFVQDGRPEHYERLKVFLLGQSDAPYAALAQELSTSEGGLARWPSASSSGCQDDILTLLPQPGGRYELYFFVYTEAPGLETSWTTRNSHAATH